MNQINDLQCVNEQFSLKLCVIKNRTAFDSLNILINWK